MKDFFKGFFLLGMVMFKYLTYYLENSKSLINGNLYVLKKNMREKMYNRSCDINERIKNGHNNNTHMVQYGW